MKRITIALIVTFTLGILFASVVSAAQPSLIAGVPSGVTAPATTEPTIFNRLMSSYRKTIRHLPSVPVSDKFLDAVKQLLNSAQIRADAKISQPHLVMTLDDWVWLFEETRRLYHRTEAEMITHLERMTMRCKELCPRLRKLLADEETARKSVSIRHQVLLPPFFETFFGPVLPVSISEREVRNLRTVGYISFVVHRDTVRHPKIKVDMETVIQADLSAFKISLEEERHVGAGPDTYNAWVAGSQQQLVKARDRLIALQRQIVQYELGWVESKENLTKFELGMIPHVRELFPSTYELRPGRLDEDLPRSFRVYYHQHPNSFDADLVLMKKLLPRLRTLYGETTDEELWAVPDCRELRALVFAGFGPDDLEYKSQWIRDYHRLWVGRLLYWTRFVKDELGGALAKLDALVADMRTTRPWVETLIGRIFRLPRYRLNQNDGHVFGLWRFLTHEYVQHIHGIKLKDLQRLLKLAAAIAQWHETAILFKKLEPLDPSFGKRSPVDLDRIVTLVGLAAQQIALSLDDTAMRAWLRDYPGPGTSKM